VPAAKATAPAPKVAKPAPEVDIEATRTDAPIDAAEPGGESYDYLFGETMHRPVAAAAVLPEDDSAPETGDTIEGDHDGHTIMTPRVGGLRGGKKPVAKAPKAQVPSSRFVLSLSTGAREPLSQPILLGRSPSASKVSGGDIPRLVTMGGADQDISRTHAKFALEGDTVVVTDLHSRNGTSVTLPGKSSQRLRGGEPTAVIAGTIVDFGGGLSVTVEEEPAGAPE
jgi:hypothetical protein